MSGHKHSPSDTNKEEDYPAHLVELDHVYKNCLAGLEDTTKSTSKENCNNQTDIVGFKAPNGPDSRAPAQMSTK